MPHHLAESGISGGVGGFSTQAPLRAIEVGGSVSTYPLSMNFMLSSGILSCTFSGTIYAVNPGDSTNFEPVPEPSMLVMVGTGLMIGRIGPASAWRTLRKPLKAFADTVRMG